MQVQFELYEYQTNGSQHDRIQGNWFIRLLKLSTLITPVLLKVFFALAFVVAAIFAAEEKPEKDLEAAGGHLLGYYGGLGYGAGLYGAGYGGYGL